MKLALSLCCIFNTLIHLYGQQRKDSISYKLLKKQNELILEFPMGIGVNSSAVCYTDINGNFRDATLYFGIRAKKYLSNNMRFDIAYLATFLGTDDFNDMEYYSDLSFRVNYPIITWTKKWIERIYMNPFEFCYVSVPKRKNINIHGGYYKYLTENKLALGLNYSSNTFAKIQLAETSRKKNGFTYFETGGEILFRTANSDVITNYYELNGENPGKLGWNIYAIFNYKHYLGSLDIGAHNGPILKVTLGFIFAG